ncbi:FHA domain-containing protein [Paenibacillus sp. LMG 31456]|uniref:FHA domain-containing protein n=1 Tax=Paenibacillus foliorum TaxID=2654974 RepID=A0A972GSR7_9BACL|nr:DUF6382 domain-containing protein [Paenibacillus foliorum]NOU93779.1 FHA domain-containing protein [Paenibacillus foliorum]
MNSQLYGLKVDFVTRNGHFMVLSSHEGIRRDELSEFQVNMLQVNKIPQLLELQIEEINQHIKLYYNITGKRMLTHWLRLESLNFKQFFTLLYRIVDTVASSNIYMLQEGRYVLKEDYIYCSDDWNELFLTYIPKELLIEKNAVSADLQHLASRLIHKVSELSGNGYQELMNYLMDESFNLPVLKQLLQKHMNQHYSSSNNNVLENGVTAKRLESSLQAPEKEKKQMTMEQSVSYVGNYANSPAPTEQEKDAQAKLSAPPSGATVEAKHSSAPSSTFLSDKGEEVLPQAEPRRKLFIPVMLVGFLGLCLIWKLYLDHSGEAWLMICSGLSLFAVDTVYWILWVRKPSLKDDEDIELDFWKSGRVQDNEEEQWGNTADGGSLVPFFVPTREPTTNPSFPPVDAFFPPVSRLESKLVASKPTESSAPISSTYYRSLEQRTTFLAPSGATVLLKHKTHEQKSQGLAPYLEWISEGVPRKALINKSAFVIGRPGGQVDLEQDEEGISRLHAEIVRENEGFWVKDLGSRNGTCLNGEILVPYRMYSLQEGDIVKIINSDYTFKMGL